MFKSKLKVSRVEKNMYCLERPLLYQYGNNLLVVPKNAQTDFASTPKWLHWLFKPQSKGYSKSSVLHDELYYSKDFNKFKSDWIFLNAMKSEQVKLPNKYKWFLTRWSFYLGVTFGGWINWWRA